MLCIIVCVCVFMSLWLLRRNKWIINQLAISLSDGWWSLIIYSAVLERAVWRERHVCRLTRLYQWHMPLSSRSFQPAAEQSTTSSPASAATALSSVQLQVSRLSVQRLLRRLLSRVVWVRHYDWITLCWCNWISVCHDATTMIAL